MAFDDDGSLPLLGELVGELVNFTEGEPEPLAGAIYVDELRITLPVEFAIDVDEQGRVALNATPPSQHLVTSVMPVWHTLKMRVVLDHDQQSTVEP